MKTKEEIKERQKKWYNKNKEKLQEKYKNNIEEINKYQKLYREKNKENAKLYRENNKEKLQEWYTNNKEKIKEYQENNKEIRNERERKRKKNEPLYRIKCNLSSRISIALKNKNFKKSKGTVKILGCDLEEARMHLYKQFTKGMTWENYGEWHIDHIIPLSSAKNKNELIKLCHYKNIQPLWAVDNIKKGNKTKIL
jgi:hypothetical protein